MGKLLIGDEDLALNMSYLYRTAYSSDMKSISLNDYSGISFRALWAKVLESI